MKLLVLLLIAFAPFLAKAACFPETDLYLTTSLTAGGIDQAVFNAQLDAVYKTYSSEVKKHGYDLYFNRLWENGTVNSDTDVEGHRWVINSYGGLARYPGMTADAYRLVACHELGHHLGGAPHYTDNDWASVEGEADYFATLRCLKETGLSRARIKAAAQSMADVMASLAGDYRPSPFSPDQSVVVKTYEDHPRAQCRLDTYLAGNNCRDQGPLSDKDARVHSCYDYQKMVGVRPRCWFAP